MQANPTTSQRRSVQHADLDNGATWNPLSVPRGDLQRAAFDSEISVPESAAHGVQDLLSLRILNQKAPDVAPSANAGNLYRVIKRGLDIVISLALLLLTLPLFVGVAILIKLTSSGPLFFKHKRLGQYGKQFWCIKFRTMYADAEDRIRNDAQLQQQFEVSYKIKDDPRVMPVGALLRKTSMDELPQLINVLRGEMSLIGPRPIVERELSKYSIYGTKLLSVKPGLSGLWQVSGRSEVDYPKRVLLDMHYIDRRCLLLDIKLLLLTPLAVFRGHGAC
jgi:lipopolysaccharide/colanic/teichoic acid biosynthesis glycosyltransferase